MDKTFFTRSLSRRDNTQVCATLRGGRVAIEKIWLAESDDAEDVEVTRRQASHEADTMRWLAVQRDADGNVLNNNSFIFSCSVIKGTDRTTLRMDTEAGWTAAEYRTRWREGQRGTRADSLPPDDFPQDTMPLPTYLARVLDIVEETAYALRSIHGAKPDGYLHCDIKPANIWIQSGQHPLERMAGVRLIDFGSAFAPRTIDSAQAPQALLEAFRHVCGTPGFWSPALHDVYLRLCDLQNAIASQTPDVQGRANSCRRALKALGPADDIYSLTATFFWMLTGQTVTGHGEDSIRKAIEQALAELPTAVQRAAADFIFGQLNICASADPPNDCDDRFIGELETLRQVLKGQTTVHPDTLRLRVKRWWRTWSVQNPACSTSDIDQDELPYLFNESPQPDINGQYKTYMIFSFAFFLANSKAKSLFLAGPRGVGKTCLLRYTFSQYLEDDGGAIPLYVPLDQIDLCDPDAILHFLSDTLLQDLPNGVEVLRLMFSIETTPRFLLLLDGLAPAQCQPGSSLYAQIQEFLSFSGLRFVAAGREALPGLLVMHVAPYSVCGSTEPFTLDSGDPHPATLIFSRPKTPFQCKALGRLEQTLHAYIPRKAYRSLSSESRQTATAAQLEAIWLYQQVHNTIESVWEKVRSLPDYGFFDKEYSLLKKEPILSLNLAYKGLNSLYENKEKLRQGVLDTFVNLCYVLFSSNKLRFDTAFCQESMPKMQNTASFLALFRLAGLLERREADYVIEENLRALGSALYITRDYGMLSISQSKATVLAEDLCKTSANPLPLLDALAELSPQHPLPQSVDGHEIQKSAFDWLGKSQPVSSVLQQLLALCRSDETGGTPLLCDCSIFKAWVYERGGDLSGCDLSGDNKDRMDLTNVRLLSAAGATKLPAHLPLHAIALLPLPETLRWMDWRNGYLLLASEQEAVVFTPKNRMLRLPLPQDCRRVLSAAVNPDPNLAGVIDSGQIEMFIETKTYATRYLPFSLASGAALQPKLTSFPIQRMDELRGLHRSKHEWTSSDKKHTLSIQRGAIVLSEPGRHTTSDELWRVSPYASSLPTPPLEYGALRLALDEPSYAVLRVMDWSLVSGGGVLLYDVEQSEPLWSVRDCQELKALLEKRLNEQLFDFRTGTFALLPDGFVFEAAFGLAGAEGPSHWIVFCDRRGKIIRYDKKRLDILRQTSPTPSIYPEFRRSMYRSLSLEMRRSFNQQECNPAAPLNHRLYAGNTLYLRSDLVPDLVLSLNMKKHAVHAWKEANRPIETLVEDDGRIIAVLAGGDTAYVVFNPQKRPANTFWEAIVGPSTFKAGATEETASIVPLRNLLRSYKRYTSHRRAFIPFITSPVTAQQVQAFAPPCQPGDALQRETFLHSDLITETIVV